MKTRMLTKDAEIKLLRQMFAALPEGYAHDILTDLLPEMERAIESDFTWVPFRERSEDAQRFTQERLQLQYAISEMESKLRELSDRKAMLDAQIDNLRSRARRMSEI